jgi:outer membrane protein
MCLWEKVKKMKLIHGLVLSAAALFLSQSLMADEYSVGQGKRPLSLGLGIAYTDKPYKSFDSSEKTKPVPIVLYEGEHFFARGDKIGWSFLDSDVLEVAVIGEYLDEGYDESDSKFLKGNGDKDATIGVGGQVIWKPENLGFMFSAVTDISGNSDGSQAVGELFYVYKVNSSLLITPSASIVWQSDDYNDYYYGVRSRAVNAASYNADSDVNYRLGVVGVYQQPDSHWMFMGSLGYTFFGDEIKDSTIVSENNALNAMLGVAYTFK